MHLQPAADSHNTLGLGGNLWKQGSAGLFPKEAESFMAEEKRERQRHSGGYSSLLAWVCLRKFQGFKGKDPPYMQVAAPTEEPRLRTLVSTSNLHPLLHSSLVSAITPSLALTRSQCSSPSPRKSLLGPSSEKSTNKHRGEAGAAQTHSTGVRQTEAT